MNSSFTGTQRSAWNIRGWYIAQKYVLWNKDYINLVFAGTKFLIYSCNWRCSYGNDFASSDWNRISLPYFTFDPRASIRVAAPCFHVPSCWRAIRTSIEGHRIGAIPGSHLSTSPTGYWTRRPLGPLIIPTGNWKGGRVQHVSQQLTVIVTSLISLHCGLVL